MNSSLSTTSSTPPGVTRLPAAAWDILAYWPLAALTAAGFGAAMLAKSRSLQPPVRSLLAGAVGGVAALGFVRWQLSRHFTALPPYEIESQLGELEVRRYPKRVQAETLVSTSDFDEGLREGFRRLAGYIFGGNGSPEKGSERIAMTSPVTSSASDQGRRVCFVMPSGRTLDSLPVPRDSRVELREEPAQTIAVLRFSGAYKAARVLEQQQRLLALARAEHLSIRGEPQFAGYDAPSTLPFLRRNEVWVRL